MIKSYKLITTKFCHNCPRMKEFMNSQDKLDGEVVDASEPEGLEVAKRYQVTGVPTLIFVDEKEEEVKRCGEIAEAEEILGTI